MQERKEDEQAGRETERIGERGAGRTGIRETESVGIREAERAGGQEAELISAQEAVQAGIRETERADGQETGRTGGREAEQISRQETGQDGERENERGSGDGKPEKLRVCRRCLTREMMGEQEEYFRNLQDYIRNLDPDIKAGPELYEDRLAVCKECDLLYQGMCRSCGCYVELRAAIAKRKCPYGKW